MSKALNKYISVFIPTYNGEKYIGECLEAVLRQEMPAGYVLECIVIDSGSKDNTLSILKKFVPRIILLEIPNSEFSHGATRNRAARMAKGEFILFLTQDATPIDYRWLISMVEPFFLSKKVGCVFGRQIPRPFVAPTIKREVATVFGSLGSPDSIIIHRPTSLVDKKPTNALNTFFSDANSAVRRDLLVGEVPFRKVSYAEDQALAEDMQNKGYLKAYAPLGAVWHSNEYTAKQYYHRKFDEFIGLQESFDITFQPKTKSLLFGWIRPTIKDWKFIWHDDDYGPRRKLLGFFTVPAYNMAEKAGLYYSAKYLHDDSKRKQHSLEESSKR